MTQKSLAYKYLEIVRSGREGVTWDQFFEENGVPSEARTNFGVAAIVNQAMEIAPELFA
jgi:hypothetical protein